MDATQNIYVGPLAIWKNKNLTDDEQEIEQQFAEQLQSRLPYWVESYLSMHGRVLDTDLARTLSATWNSSPENRARYASAVHNPSSAFISYLFACLVTQPADIERRAILFTAGGGGSGKTTAVQQKAADFLRSAHLVYDTTFSHYASSNEKIQLALAANKKVSILFIYRPFLEAVRGVIERAIMNGRVVPLNVLANDHVGAPNTVLQLAIDHAENSQVEIRVIDNSGSDIAHATVLKGQAMLDFLRQKADNNIEAMEQEARKVLDHEIKNRQGTSGSIPEYINESFRRIYTRRPNR